jgi:hypothetical protein
LVATWRSAAVGRPQLELAMMAAMWTPAPTTFSADVSMGSVKRAVALSMTFALIGIPYLWMTWLT